MGGGEFLSSVQVVQKLGNSLSNSLMLSYESLNMWYCLGPWLLGIVRARCQDLGTCKDGRYAPLPLLSLCYFSVPLFLLFRKYFSSLRELLLVIFNLALVGFSNAVSHRVISVVLKGPYGFDNWAWRLCMPGTHSSPLNYRPILQACQEIIHYINFGKWLWNNLIP